MDDVTVKLEGLKELDTKLGQMRDDLAKNAMKSGVRAGGNVVLAGIRQRVPVGRGKVISTRKGPARRRIREDIRLSTKFTGLTADATIKPRKFAYIVNWLERTGAKPHREPKRGKGKLFIPGVGFVSSIEHPGFKARPFIIPAFNATWQRALEAIREKLAATIDKYKERV